MHCKTLLAAALAGGALMGISSVAQAVPAIVATTPHVIVQAAPPAPIFEAEPAPREGWTWTPGHYEWRGDHYAWISGTWVRDRQGWEWQEAEWIQRADGSWYLAGGQWVRSDRFAYDDDMRDRRWNSPRFGPNGDLDGDGIRNADDRDRDGDGVANRDDDFPNNPNRS